MIHNIIISIIGGLALFLYGISLMSNSIRNLAENKLKLIIQIMTKNVLTGILTGILVTSLIQSSSGTTVLTITLIRAGLMTMPQALGIIMGANIGTTITAFLFSLPNITEYSLLFVGIGVFLIFFFKRTKTLLLGQVILGFGLIFYGMDLMCIILKQISQTPQFTQWILNFTNTPFTGLLTGIIMTVIIQSSSAATGIIQSLYESGALSSLKTILPILLGSNIGTTITAILAVIGGSLIAKKAALFHVIFNVFGALLFLFLLQPYYDLILMFKNSLNTSPRLTIAIAHLIFNLINTLIFIWFINEIIWIINKIMKVERK